VASEPLVTAPVAMAFDENGRLFVAELPESADRPKAQPQPGRIRMLQDTNGDGVFETSAVYADNLPPVSAVACYGGGLFLGATPDLLYLKPAATNAAILERQVLFSGFGGTNDVVVPMRVNNLNWGLDNRIHGITGGLEGGEPVASMPGGAAPVVAGNDFAFDPSTFVISAEDGPAHTGLSFDDRGRKFVSESSRPLRVAMYERRYAARNPFFAAPRQMLDAASPATLIFPLVPSEPPGVGGATPRTTNGLALTLFQATNAPASAWLTNACGSVVYRGSAFPPGYAGNVFVADPRARVIHRMVLHENGLAPAAVRPPEESKREFLASNDASFRPVQVVNGPDGALYIADRQTAGDRGRIYRIVPVNFKRPKAPQLGRARTYDLVATLSHPNGWQRDTAARLLYARRDPAAVPQLTSVLSYSLAPLARLHALHAIEGAGALNQAHLFKALADKDERVRVHAVLLSEKWLVKGASATPLGNQLLKLAADPALRVRYQLAFTLGELQRPDTAQALAEILRRSPAYPWMQAAVLSSVGEGAGNLFVALAGDAQFRSDPGGREFLRRLATMIGVSGRPDDTAPLLEFMARTPLQPQQAFMLAYALGEGLRRSGGSLPQVDPEGRLQKYYVEALRMAGNNFLFDPVRVEAVRLLGVDSYTFATAGDRVLLLLGTGQPEAVEFAAIGALGRFDDPQIAPALFRRWRVLTPRLRREAVTALLGRSNRVAEVLAALGDGRISRADVAPAQLDFLRTHRDPAISREAVRLFGPVPTQRPAVRRQFSPSLRLTGVPDRGRAIFLARCSACHRLGGGGQTLGPDLAAARLRSKGSILSAIIEPKAEIRPEFATYAVETATGESLIGLLRDQNSTTLTLAQPYGVDIVLPRANVPYLRSQDWSLMPAGLEEGLTPQDMADLLEYIAPVR
jgi:putative membrane-bound dehydrogenase-like protein